MSLNQIDQILNTIHSYAWGLPSIVILIGTGIYLTIRLRFIQFRCFGTSWKLLFSKPSGSGDISRFAALSAALSGTIGTGNIAGVATAITLGGPGAIFWMWITAIFGMATKYAAATLAVHFREQDPKGRMAGGPMYTLKNGLNMPKVGALFALFTVIASFGIGCTVQANSIVSGLHYVFPITPDHNLLLGFIMAVLVAVVIIGGITRIGHVASVLVPFMCITYVAFALLILVLNYQAIPHAFALIFNQALNPHAAGAGALGAAIRYGVARGIFSNEAGLGSDPIAHAAATTIDPTKQGMVAMLGPFIDTIIICTMTALVIIIAGQPELNHYDGAQLSAHAFASGLAHFPIQQLGSWVVGIGLVLFAYSTMITWSYYGDRCAEYLFGIRAVMPYRIIFSLMVIVGAVLPLGMVWTLADIANIFMAIPNLLSVLLLAGLLKKLEQQHQL